MYSLKQNTFCVLEFPHKSVVARYIIKHVWLTGAGEQQGAEDGNGNCQLLPDLQEQVKILLN